MFVVVGLMTAASAAAVPPSLFTQFPQGGSSGAGADQLNAPLGLDTDPSTGHLYVGEVLGNRISEFTAWGEFVKAWGWGVLDGAPAAEVCTADSGCQQGLEGSGSGQLATPTGVAVDDAGAIYVVDHGNHRVEKFSPSGQFLLMFGGEVNKTTNGNVCPEASGDECGAGTVGTDPGQFGNWSDGDVIDVGSGGTILVGDEDRIQEFEPDGSFKSALPLPLERAAKAVAVDPTGGGIYVSLEQSINVETPEVPVFYRLSPTDGEVLQEYEVGDPDAEPFPILGVAEGLATDSEGHVYAIARQKQTTKQGWQEVLEFEANGTCLICAGDRFGQPESSVGLSALTTSSACDVQSDPLYVAQFGGGKSYVRAYGPTPDPSVCQPPPIPPAITDQYAVSVDAGGALVRAQINPRFWADTRYYVEYGTGECAKGGCEVQPVAPGELLGNKAVGVPLTTAGILLSGLQPNTEYHYRFVAESGGGGPVKGVGGEIGNDGEEATFRTFPVPENRPACSTNQQFRTGPSASLPDCRAYEMVSPLDKDGGDVVVLRTINAYPAGLAQSSLDGNGLAYSSYRAFGAPQGAPWSSQYVASRQAGQGWTSKAVSPPREGGSFFNTAGLEVQYKLFSPDLCTGWFLQDAEPPLDPAAPAGFADLYRRDNCGGGSYRALNTVAPTPTASPAFMPTLQGASTDGRCSVFRANGKLTADASSAVVNGEGVYQVYETCDGELHLVSVLPDGTPDPLQSSAGTADAADSSRTHNVWHAVSPSGSRVYWTASEGSGPGRIYVRDNAEQEQSQLVNGDCTEPEKACTYPVSTTVSPANAQFWGADTTGSVALFSIGANLYEFNFEQQHSTLIAGQVVGWLGASDDANRIYFASEEVRAPGATAGEPNLYLFEKDGEGGRAFTFLATLSDLDNVPGELSPIAKRPIVRTSRVSSDGAHVAFASRSKALSESVAGFDNTDANSGKPDTEVYLYDAQAETLSCVSCNPTGARPSGRELIVQAQPSGIWAAAQLPTWESQLYAQRALSEDGSRLFFESFEALEPRDTNGRRDVYQWEAEGKGDCDPGDATFSVGSRGCVSLISSGKSPEDSEFVDATPSGADVFFATAASLLPQDYGQVDIYDARADGGLPPPPAPSAPCEGEACQGSSVPPQDPTPASLGYRGVHRLPGCARARAHSKARRKSRCRGKKRHARSPGKHRRSHSKGTRAR